MISMHMEAGRGEIAGRNTPVLPVGSEEPVAKREEDDGGENAMIVVQLRQIAEKWYFQVEAVAHPGKRSWWLLEVLVRC